jgi:hypothetical protein
VDGSAPAAQIVSIAIGGSGTLPWSALSNAFWASVSPASGSAPATLSVSVNPANLAAGSYTGAVQIVTTGSPVSVSMTLVVQGTQPAGTITGVANGASFDPAFASATWVSIFGTNLSATSTGWGAATSQTVCCQPRWMACRSPSTAFLRTWSTSAHSDQRAGSRRSNHRRRTGAGDHGRAESNSFTAQKQQFAPAFFTFDNGKYVAAQHSNYSLLGAPA